MRKILITGANSYIGMSFEKYLTQCADDYQVDTVDMIDGTWKKKSFAGYDTVFHVAGIAHQKETSENAPLYYKINRDLAIETAQKAKADGVKQFVFLSSMSIYGQETGVITKDTVAQPKSNYGHSKLMEEEGIRELEDEAFGVCIVRPPMVYGKNCKGNFQTLVRFATKAPLFPKVQNQRSMIFIDNLCAFVKIAVDRELRGVYCPQNKEYVQTSEMVSMIAQVTGHRLWISRLAGIGVSFIKPFLGVAQKAFGSLIYQSCEDLEFEYCVVDFGTSIERSV